LTIKVLFSFLNLPCFCARIRISGWFNYST